VTPEFKTVGVENFFRYVQWRARLQGKVVVSKLCVFHYYSLGGDTVEPSELYAGLCHAFIDLVFSMVA